MRVAQPADHLEFGDDLVLGQEVDSPLLHGAEPALPHLPVKGVLVNLFNNP
jgi:hypothetical protein